MRRSWQIEPVPARRLLRAATFMVAGADRSTGARLRAEGLCRRARARRPYPPWAWWARRGRRLGAAAMVLPGAGRVGMVFSSPADAGGVDAEALAAVLSRVAAAAVEGGMTFAQALSPPEASGDITALERGGFERLGELLYLVRDAVGVPVAAPRAELTWRTYEAFDEAELSDVIRQTYTGSLDCPRLSGLRSMTDVLAGHKAGGTFRPDLWLLACCGGRPAGVVLANEAEPGRAEIVYMGVVPGFRGRRIGAALVGQAAHRARASGLSRVALAVDADNAPARAVYEPMGFELERRRVVHIRRSAGRETVAGNTLSPGSAADVNGL
ncbi:MAG: GNAT family N-acetyltransferase [Planctomycetota bacterium]